MMSQARPARVANVAKMHPEDTRMGTADRGASVKTSALKINADLGKPAIEIPESLEWRASPIAGVWRRMLDRDGDEVARCTTIVRYDSKASFPEHTHDEGEEFLVLKGTFSDPLTGPCPTGFYVRNPIGSTHSPWTDSDGTEILVKLRQMTDPTEPHVFLDTKAFYDKADKSSDVVKMNLFTNEKTGETVTMEWWQPEVSKSPKAHFDGNTNSGLEIFLMNGDLQHDGKEYQHEAWFRFPASEDSSIPAFTSKGGCQLWIKTGHL